MRVLPIDSHGDTVRATGFFYSETGVEGGNGAFVAGLFAYNNLQTTGTISGQSGFDTGYEAMVGFPTSVGQLLIDSDTQAAGTFVTAAVPEPSTHALLLMGAGAVCLWKRRKRSL